MGTHLRSQRATQVEVSVTAADFEFDVGDSVLVGTSGFTVAAVSPAGSDCWHCYQASYGNDLRNYITYASDVRIGGGDESSHAGSNGDIPIGHVHLVSNSDTVSYAASGDFTRERLMVASTVVLNGEAHEVETTGAESQTLEIVFAAGADNTDAGVYRLTDRKSVV